MENEIMVQPQSPPLRDISVLLDTAFNFFLRNWKKMIPFQILASLLAIAPLIIILIAYAITTGSGGANNLSNPEIATRLADNITSTNITLGALGILSVIFLLMVILGVQIALIKYTANQESIWSKFKEILLSRRLWGYLCLNILVGLIVVIGLICLIIPGLVAAIFLNLAGYYYVIGNQTIIQSIKSSINSVKNLFWEFLLRIIVIMAIGMAVSIVINILSLLAGYLNQNLTGWSKIISISMLVLVYVISFIAQEFMMVFNLSYKYNVFVDFKK